jgi:hypothetical protein
MVSNVDYDRNYFCIKNIAELTAATIIPCNHITYWADIIATSINPFQLNPGNFFVPYRILEITNKSVTDVLVYINGQSDNIVYVKAGSTKTLGTEYKLYYSKLSTYASAAIAIGDLIIEGRR